MCVDEKRFGDHIGKVIPRTACVQMRKHLGIKWAGGFITCNYLCADERMLGDHMGRVIH